MKLCGNREPGMEKEIKKRNEKGEI